MKLAIIIPAYNEESAIKDVLLSLPKKLNGIDKIISVVVDDGSADKTYEIAKSYATYAVKHVVNLGVGAATTTGLEAAKKLKSDIAVTIDADGQHHPKDIEKVIQPILCHKADMVIGTRMQNTKGMPVLKVFGNWFMNFLTFLVFQKWSSDSQSGMKAINSEALKKMRLHSVGYEVCSEMVGEIKRNKLRFEEIPIKVIYTDYSKMRGQNWINGINVLTKMLVIRMTGKR
jgi:glycosyltransferase involved in cell wall biosynthesis